MPPVSTSERTATGPALPSGSRFWRGWIAAFGVTVVLVTLATLPPFLPAGPRAVLMQAFTFACHQIPARSPHLDGVALAVCHRCYGIYWGLALAAGAFLLLRAADPFLNRQAKYVLLASLAPMAVDWGGDVVGLWVNTPASRTITGLFFGLVAGYYLTRALVRALMGEHAPPPDPWPAETEKHDGRAPT